jgi:hypothetical protein
MVCHGCRVLVLGLTWALAGAAALAPVMVLLKQRKPCLKIGWRENTRGVFKRGGLICMKGKEIDEEE